MINRIKPALLKLTLGFCTLFRSHLVYLLAGITKRHGDKKNTSLAMTDDDWR